MTVALNSSPEQGQLVSVRSRNWIVNEVVPSTLPTRGLQGIAASQTLVSLASVEDDGLGEEIQVVWELEPGARLRAESGTGAESGSGKRDRYDIDKMGSFGLCFGDATYSADRSWWNGFSRFKSRRGANAVVRESGRLPSIRAGFAGYS